MLHEKFDKLPGYNPDGLLDELRKVLAVKNDAALARALRLGQPIISKLRSRRTPVTAGFILRSHEVSQLPVSKLRRMLGVSAS